VKRAENASSDTRFLEFIFGNLLLAEM